MGLSQSDESGKSRTTENQRIAGFRRAECREEDSTGHLENRPHAKAVTGCADGKRIIRLKKVEKPLKGVKLLGD